MAVVRSLVIVAGYGLDQCCVVDIAGEEDAPIGQARVLAGCPNEPVGALTKINAGICAEHIAATDREGALILE